MFRKAMLDDGRRVYQLICDMEKKELPYDPFIRIFRRQLEDPRYYCLLMEKEGRVIGELNLRFEEQLHHCNRIAEILEFTLDEAWRNRGIGKEMLEEACRIAESAGCVQIEVACNQLRTDTHRFYLREGMHNFHYKFTKPLIGGDSGENALGK